MQLKLNDSFEQIIGPHVAPVRRWICVVGRRLADFPLQQLGAVRNPMSCSRATVSGSNCKLREDVLVFGVLYEFHYEI